MNRNLLVESLLLVVILIWGLNFTVVKFSLREIDPMSFNSFRYLLATGLMVAILLRSGQNLRVHKGDWPRIIALGLLGNLTYQCLFIVGIDFTFAANAAVMLGTIPVWVALSDRVIYGRILQWPTLAGIALAFSGIVLIMEGSATGITLRSENIVGDLILILAAFIFGLYTLLSKSFLSRYSPIQLTTLMMLTGGTGVVLAGVPWALQLDYGSVSAAAWGGVVYSGLLSIGISYMIWNYGIRQVGTVRTATFQNLIPVAGLLFGVLLLGEQLFLMQYAGAALIIAGIVLARRR